MEEKEPQKKIVNLGAIVKGAGHAMHRKFHAPTLVPSRIMAFVTTAARAPKRFNAPKKRTA
jgi:hypothetical protein